MAHVRIEFDTGDGRGFRMRQEGDADATAATLTDMLPSFAIQYPHKAFLDGELVAQHAGPAPAKERRAFVRPSTIYTEAFWQAAPAYDTVAFWVFALGNGCERDLYKRDLVVIGHGAAGPIRCTKDYAKNRLDLVKGVAREARLAKRLGKMC